jgi:hypothetical protein
MQVDADQPVWVLERHVGRHTRPEVAALGAVALVAEARHQPVPQPRRVPRGVAGRPLREAVAGKRRDDEVEGAEVRHELEVLDERARPAVGEDQRQPAAPHVGVVDPHAADVGEEVVDLVQPPLLLAPVEPVGPVREQVAQVAEVGALHPGRLRRRRGPAGPVDPLAKVGQDALLDRDREGLRLHGG